MADAVTEGNLTLEEGSLYWKYEKSENSARPTLVFSHAGVSDHTVWDEPVKALVRDGWSCLRYDLFGFGKSVPNDRFLSSDPPPPIDYAEQLSKLIQHVLPAQTKVIPAGLSMGGGFSLSYAIRHPESVAGLIILAGGVPWEDYPNDPKEDELGGQIDELISAGDIEKAARMQVHFWGDGPLQPAGRLAAPEAERLLAWTRDISWREHKKIGGGIFVSWKPDPSLRATLKKMSLPVAIGYGTFDETATTSCMKELAATIAGVTVKEFKAAHMIPLEVPEETTQFLEGWLRSIS